MRLLYVSLQDPSVTTVTEPPPSGQEEYNPFAEEGKQTKTESEVSGGKGRRERGRALGRVGGEGEKEVWNVTIFSQAVPGDVPLL